MTFISLVAALLLEQLRPLRSGNRLYVGFARYVNAIARNLNAGQYRDGMISWLLAVVPLALVTGLITVILHYISIALVLIWNVAVLYLVLGFRHFSHFFNDIILALRAGDVGRARSVLNVWRGKPSQELSAGETARVSIELGLAHSHRHVFGVMIWFVVFGAAGAIVYRLASLLNDRWNGDQLASGSFGVFAARAFYIIDWLPVRLTAISFAVAGDFMGAVECWRDQAASWPVRSQGILFAAAAGALGIHLGGVLHEEHGVDYRPQVGNGAEPDVDGMQAAVGLIWRSLVLWLFLIALSTIASWF